jgi:2-oxoisovalerate dehydrogenase E1 component alpha subunit
MVGSATALGPKDIITCQYREIGEFQQRGFTLKDFMSQLASNRNYPGKGRNMPYHYSGKEKTGVVSLYTPITNIERYKRQKLTSGCFF